MRAEVAVMARDFPIEQDVFHLRSAPYVVNDKVATCTRGLSVHHHADVRHVATQVPRYKITGGIVFFPHAGGQRFAFASQKSHQIGNAAVINACVRMGKEPTPLIWIRREIAHHVLVNFFLQVNSNGAICPNNFIGAHAGVGRNIAIRIGNADVSRVIADDVVSAVDGSGDQFLQKLLMIWWSRRRVLVQSRKRDQHQKEKDNWGRGSHRQWSTEIYPIEWDLIRYSPYVCV